RRRHGVVEGPPQLGSPGWAGRRRRGRGARVDARPGQPELPAGCAARGQVRPGTGFGAKDRAWTGPQAPSRRGSGEASDPLRPAARAQQDGCGSGWAAGRKPGLPRNGHASGEPQRPGPRAVRKSRHFLVDGRARLTLELEKFECNRNRRLPRARQAASRVWGRAERGLAELPQPPGPGPSSAAAPQTLAPAPARPAQAAPRASRRLACPTGSAGRASRVCLRPRQQRESRVAATGPSADQAGQGGGSEHEGDAAAPAPAAPTPAAPIPRWVVQRQESAPRCFSAGRQLPRGAGACGSRALWTTAGLGADLKARGTQRPALLPPGARWAEGEPGRWETGRGEEGQPQSSGARPWEQAPSGLLGRAVSTRPGLVGPCGGLPGCAGHGGPDQPLPGARGVSVPLGRLVQCWGQTPEAAPGALGRGCQKGGLGQLSGDTAVLCPLLGPRAGRPPGSSASRPAAETGRLRASPAPAPPGRCLQRTKVPWAPGCRPRPTPHDLVLTACASASGARSAGPRQASAFLWTWPLATDVGRPRESRPPGPGPAKSQGRGPPSPPGKTPRPAEGPLALASAHPVRSGRGSSGAQRAGLGWADGRRTFRVGGPRDGPAPGGHGRQESRAAAGGAPAWARGDGGAGGGPRWPRAGLKGTHCGVCAEEREAAGVRRLSNPEPRGAWLGAQDRGGSRGRRGRAGGCWLDCGLEEAAPNGASSGGAARAPGRAGRREPTLGGEGAFGCAVRGEASRGGEPARASGQAGRAEGRALPRGAGAWGRACTLRLLGEQEERQRDSRPRRGLQKVLLVGPWLRRLYSPSGVQGHCPTAGPGHVEAGAARPAGLLAGQLAAALIEQPAAAPQRCKVKATALCSPRLGLGPRGLGRCMGSTFCSIIAQLTEETQPIFETTLKSRAVSEGSDVRFTCVVTGYPEPEVTWYKDDKELDRYCGLPKYQITRQGNRHTLQLYRCQEEDAAIYQASARNAKGIVSCSGVLEVGTMTEYQIHQRWFAKLKTKAAAKMRELEQGWGRGPEAAREVDPDRPQRKRRLGGAAAQGTPPPREPAAPPDGEAGPGQPPGLGLVSRLAAGEVTTNGEAAPDNREAADAGLLTYLCEAMERGPQGAPQKASGAKKTKKAEQAGRGLRRADAGKTARGHPSENCVPGPDGSGSCGPQRPLDVGQTQPRGRATQGPPGPAGAESARKPASAAGTQGRAQNGLARAPAPAPAQALAPASVKAPARAIAPAPAPAPAQDLAPAPASEVYFSLKDLYAESTRVASPQDQEGPSGTVPRETRCEGGPAAPRQPAPAVAPPPVRPFNRKRFAPPKSQGEPGTDSQPSSPPSRAPEPAAQRFAGGPPQAAAPVPTPPARRRHGPQDSPPQGPAGRRAPGEALLSSAPPQCLGLGTPAETAAAGGSGAWAPGPDGSPPRPRSCDPGLIDSLRNYLLLLLQLSSAEPGGEGPQPRGGAAPAALAPPVAVAGLSPRTSRRVLERAENDRLVQSAQSLLLSPCTSRRLAHLLDQEAQAASAALSPGPRGPPVPAIVVGGEGPGPAVGGPGGEGAASPGSSGGGLPGEAGGPGPLSAARGAQEPPREEGRAGLPAATPQELALGARRKRFLPKGRAAGDGETAESEGGESPTVSPRRPRKGLVPGSPGPPGRERRSPTQGRRADTLQVPSAGEEPAADPGASPPASDQDAELAPEEAKTKKAPDLLKAPQVIRKIRAEQFPDASGSLKLWCQFFNVLGDSVLTWAKDQRPVGEVGRRAGDEGPAALAIVQASEADCGLYRCTIRNQHGEASTDFCLGPEVGEEIEVTPMVFAKGLADSGCWGDKLFGRLAGAAPRGCVCGGGLRKASRARVIYGLEPVFASGRTCVIKVSSLLVFGPSSEASLVGRNYDVTIQSCKTQNMSREYCKIFAAEARAVPGFGEVPEIVPLYLVYRPASNVPYATLEEDLGRPPETVCSREWDGAEAPAASSTSEAGQKCRTFQHWLYQWTNGSFLVTDLAGVGWKMTDVQIAAKLRGYQGLKESCSPALLDQFVSAHKCNAFCAMLGLQPLWGPEAAHPPAKAKGPKSPSAGRKGPQLSPQPQKRGLPSPQGPRRSAPSTRPAPLASDRRGSAQPPPHEGAPEATPPEEAGAAAARGVETSLPGD
ncbi:Alpha-protein kinase 3, partial [Galemys pyrenaicus]